MTFGSVSDWSEEEEKGLEAGLPLSSAAEEEEEGKYLLCTGMYMYSTSTVCAHVRCLYTCTHTYMYMYVKTTSTYMYMNILRTTTP